MSRIIGIIPAHNQYPAERLLGKALSALTPSHEWRQQKYVFGGTAFGWCGWREPNVASANGILVMLDGIIYNRDELGSAENDAALLLELCAKHGVVEALTKINGDFAVAVYQEEKRVLHLARDRFGVKPLYYCRFRDGIDD